MSNFPHDVQSCPTCNGQGRYHLYHNTTQAGSKMNWVRELLLFWWNGDRPNILPWRLRCAAWNYLWDLKGDSKIDWRTHKTVGEGRRVGV